MEKQDKGYYDIVAQALARMESLGTGRRSDGSVNLAELGRMTGLSRQRLRTMQANGFREPEVRRKGREPSIQGACAEHFDSLLRSGVTNSEVILRSLRERCGYSGGISSVKRYKAKHMDLVPARRELVAMQGPRVRRYTTGPGEMYQMDWGFMDVDSVYGKAIRCAVFVMVCHHCGMRYIEFFPSARQENLFVGMTHAFMAMGMPGVVLTDNMASVVCGRFPDGSPKWNLEYAAYCKALGFETRLCKARHPFTKGAVERLVRFVKDNFAPGRRFLNVTDLNEQGWRWCDAENGRLQRGLGVIPAEEHRREPLASVGEGMMDILMPYLAPERTIAIDGFVSLDGRRYGVPFSYHGKTVRVMRRGDTVVVMDPTCSFEIVRHSCDWSRKPHYCAGQFEDRQPEELPTAPVRTVITQVAAHDDDGFGQFDFAEEDGDGTF